LAIFAADRAVTAEEFRTYKFDACYAPDSDFAVLVKEIAQRNYAGDPLLEEAGEILRRYDLCTDKDNRGAALAVLTAIPLLRATAAGLPRPDAVETLRASANRLLSEFARLDPLWGTVNRLRRDALNLPVSGAPDGLRSIELQQRLRPDGTSSAEAGDSLTLISTWTKDGRWQVDSVAPFGTSHIAGARHSTDQAQLFADGKLKSVPLTEAELMAQATRIERPGRPTPRGNAAPAVPNRAAPPPPSAGIVTRPANASERTPSPAR
jgi:penicillin amidase/acyl-homoserine-lactone acylase